MHVNANMHSRSKIVMHRNINMLKMYCCINVGNEGSVTGMFIYNAY